MITSITSPKNPLIKEVLNLQGKSRERKNAGLIVIEGKKEISLAVAAGLRFRKILYCPEIIPLDDVKTLARIQFVSSEV